jgi:hypothetical protein
MSSRIIKSFERLYPRVVICSTVAGGFVLPYYNKELNDTIYNTFGGLYIGLFVGIMSPVLVTYSSISLVKKGIKGVSIKIN